jgi:archaellum component FlaC
MLERLGWLEAKLDADQEKIERKMKACLEAAETCLEKMEATMKAGQERAIAEIKTGLEEIKATVRSVEKR